MQEKQFQPGITVEVNGEANTFGLFPPIVCQSPNELPNVIISETSATRVVVQVLFAGEKNPITITLALGELVSK
jgi:hypothetical protein